ncbi:type II toxin-antitoxin system VapC family toxin [Falsiroseomonas sp.]|uniref:type II toxin-antitoxin system VapC family toxin n=1 Tax=Falsiroseomonas sp. TaxID=2870721 RepID=UPI003F72829D
MRAVDTNILVRFLTGDDPMQAEAARRIIGQSPVFVPRTVLLEVEWVLRGVYGLPAVRVLRALRDIAGIPGVTLEDAALVARAIGWAEAGMDLADALHLAAAGSCTEFVTFDRRFVKTGAKVGGVKVVEA